MGSTPGPTGATFAAASTSGSSLNCGPLNPAMFAAPAPPPARHTPHPAPPPARPPPPPPPPRPPRPRPAGGVDGTFGSAPCAISSFIASTSTAYAARQNGVVPSMFSRPQFGLPQLLNAKYQGCFLIRALTSAPRLMSESISSRYVVFCVWI